MKIISTFAVPFEKERDFLRPEGSKIKFIDKSERID